MGNGYLVEHFGAVRSHQSPALNFHLAQTTERFDREYQRSVGPLGTQQHLKDRYGFQSDLAAHLLCSFRDDDGEIAGITTASSFSYDHGAPIFSVTSRSRFQSEVSVPLTLKHWGIA